VVAKQSAAIQRESYTIGEEVTTTAGGAGEGDIFLGGVCGFGDAG
jgi:hypothetical protein